MPEFKVLGSLQVICGEQNFIPIPPKARSVLALLLMRANYTVSLDAFIDELWATRSPRSAVTSVQTYIWQLRRTFARVANCGGQIIESRAPGYRISVAPGQLDARDFEQRLRLGRSLCEAGRYGDAAALLRTALDMWTGPALADVPRGELLQAHAAELEELRISALELRVKADMKLGRHSDLVGELRTLVQTYPFNERFHGHLIAALSRSGRRGDALSAYQDVRVLLCEELGVDPSSDLQILHRQILTSGAPEPRGYPRALTESVRR